MGGIDGEIVVCGGVAGDFEGVGGLISGGGQNGTGGDLGRGRIM